ncbi:MAG: hypothetical protein QOJ50_252, partial [Cryptosporangiaceae bacterium]|nr:hypothetical protein [Cryptosporangiaceae bacterium]
MPARLSYRAVAHSVTPGASVAFLPVT